MEKQSMLGFKYLGDFVDFYESLDFIRPWKITTENMNERGRRIENRRYTEKIRKLFAQKKLFRRMVSVAEIISFIDGYEIMSRVVKELKNDLSAKDFQAIELFNEYKIAFSKNRRIDYIFKYDKKLILVEFRVSTTFPNISGMWQKKETELLIYKELLQNYLPDYYKIHLYALIAMPEYHLNQPIPKQIKYNADNVRYFSAFLREIMVKEFPDIQGY